MDGPGAATSYYPLDRPEPPADERLAADIRNVEGDYFNAMGVSLVQGRLFDTRDGPQGPRTAVVNRTLADTHWPDGNALGKPLYISWETDEPWEIVGVVEDVRLVSLEVEPRGAIYLNYPRTPYFNWLQMVLRTSGDPAPLIEALRREVQALDPTLPVGRLRVMRDVVHQSAARPRMTAFMMGMFAALATLLAAVGLYGVLAYAVSRRKRELGVRVAMGAKPGDILKLVVRQGLVLVAVGLIVGLGLALVGGRVVGSLLYQIQPADPVALGGAGIFLFVVGILACVTPALRASRTQPAEALKSE
jgi:putative ABC transport system permease protein